MSDKQDQNIEAIAKLLFLTQHGKINWISIDPSVIRTSANDEVICSAFLCSYKEKQLRIYLRKYKAMPAPIDWTSQIFGVKVQKTSEPRWYSEVILELTDDRENSAWQFPKEKILHDLLEAVKYKASGAHDLIQSLLSE